MGVACVERTGSSVWRALAPVHGASSRQCVERAGSSGSVIAPVASAWSVLALMASAWCVLWHGQCVVGPVRGACFGEVRRCVCGDMWWGVRGDMSRSVSDDMWSRGRE